MTITRETLHHLIDVVNNDKYKEIFRFLMENLPTEEMLPDEEDEILAGRKEISNGEYYTMSEIDWE